MTNVGVSSSPDREKVWLNRVLYCRQESIKLMMPEDLGILEKLRRGLAAFTNSSLVPREVGSVCRVYRTYGGGA